MREDQCLHGELGSIFRKVDVAEGTSACTGDEDVVSKAQLGDSLEDKFFIL